eukprot:584395_1
MPLLQIPGMISLGGGMPSSDLFPFKKIRFSLQNGETVELSEKDVNESLQYSPTPGLPGLVKFLRDFQSKLHYKSADSTEWSLSVTTGSTEALSMAFEMLTEDGDSVLVDDPMYPGTLSQLLPRRLKLIGMKTDGDGVIPSELRNTLENLSGNINKPKVLYTIPTGQNPSGSTTTVERKKQIYEIAREHDLIIMEDDPYYFLNFGPDSAPTPENESSYLTPSNTSYLAMDVDGRVLRFDSLSKVLAPGLRLGFVTGPSVFLERINFHMQACSLHTSGLSQQAAVSLFRHWGPSGLQAHLRKTQLFYMRRRDAAVRAVERHLTGLARWNVPNAGMFLWIELLGVPDTKELIEKKAIGAKVILVPGQSFSPTGQKSSFVRAAFSTVSENDFEIGIERLASLLREKVG